MAEFYYAVSFMRKVIYAQTHVLSLYAGCHYAECRYAECRYSDGLGAV